MLYVCFYYVVDGSLDELCFARWRRRVIWRKSGRGTGCHFEADAPRSITFSFRGLGLARAAKWVSGWGNRSALAIEHVAAARPRCLLRSL